MREIACAQYSDLWWEARRGVPTASCFDKIITSRGELSKSADKYLCSLIAEKITLNPNFFTEREGHTVAMRNGIALEPEARNWVAMQTNKPVRQVGFFTTDDGAFGCSPDGMIGDDEFLELKCCNLETHLAWLLKGKVVPREHRIQVQGHLAVGIDNGGPIKRVRFVSYAPPADPLDVVTEPDEFTEKVAKAVRQFSQRMQDAVGTLATQGAADIKIPPAVQAGIDEELRKWQERLAGCDSLNVAEVCTKVNALLPALREVAPVAKQACWAETKRKMTEIGCVWHADYKTFGPKEPR